MPKTGSAPKAKPLKAKELGSRAHFVIFSLTPLPSPISDFSSIMIRPRSPAADFERFQMRPTRATFHSSDETIELVNEALLEEQPLVDTKKLSPVLLTIFGVVYWFEVNAKVILALFIVLGLPFAVYWNWVSFRMSECFSKHQKAFQDIIQDLFSQKPLIFNGYKDTTGLMEAVSAREPAERGKVFPINF